MQSFEDFISDKEIIKNLCRMRAKIAKRRNKKHSIHLTTTDDRHNYHLKVSNNDSLDIDLSNPEKVVADLLPRRKQWRKLGKYSRNKDGQSLNSIDKNVRSLIATIDFFKRTNPQEPFILRLGNFLNDLRSAIKSSHYQISRPEIYPKPKEQNKRKLANRKNIKNTCRPISLYNIKDKIIIGLVSKYLTQLFDNYFYEHSLAFRARKMISDVSVTPTHHHAIKKIKDYLALQKRGKLWVAECDMKKFYDSVNHTVIKISFTKLLRKAQRDNPTIDFSVIKRLFNSYLGSYSFPSDVLPLNKQPSHFGNIPNGEYGWIEKELIKTKYYKRIHQARIGVPQGGALSGLIANIVLDYADKQVMKCADKNLLYIRYCDDMIIMHPNRSICQQAFKRYIRALKTLKLIPHPCEDNLTNTSDSFWNEDIKSKSPYKWCAENFGGLPWIGFVGYEIHHIGHVRVRKKSLNKQLAKQEEIVNQAIHAAQKHTKRVSNKKIEESVINKLIGMSVGRVKLWNAETIKNEMCWIKGFTELNNNKYVIAQLRRLDRSRNKLIKELKSKLAFDGETRVPNTGNSSKAKNIDYYGKPFSYYFHVIERESKT